MGRRGQKGRRVRYLLGVRVRLSLYLEVGHKITGGNLRAEGRGGESWFGGRRIEKERGPPLISL